MPMPRLTPTAYDVGTPIRPRALANPSHFSGPRLYYGARSASIPSPLPVQAGAVIQENRVGVDTHCHATNGAWDVYEVSGTVRITQATYKGKHVPNPPPGLYFAACAGWVPYAFDEERLFAGALTEDRLSVIIRHAISEFHHPLKAVAHLPTKDMRFVRKWWGHIDAAPSVRGMWGDQIERAFRDALIEMDAVDDAYRKSRGLSTGPPKVKKSTCDNNFAQLRIVPEVTVVEVVPLQPIDEVEVSQAVVEAFQEDQGNIAMSDLRRACEVLSWNNDSVPCPVVIPMADTRHIPPTVRVSLLRVGAIVSYEGVEYRVRGVTPTEIRLTPISYTPGE